MAGGAEPSVCTDESFFTTACDGHAYVRRDEYRARETGSGDSGTRRPFTGSPGLPPA